MTYPAFKKKDEEEFKKTLVVLEHLNLQRRNQDQEEDKRGNYTEEEIRPRGRPNKQTTQEETIHSIEAEDTTTCKF